MRQDGCLVILELISAGRSLRRLLRLWVEFIDDVTIVVTLNHLTIYIRFHLYRVVRLQFLAVEAQIGHQTGLITVRALLRVGVDERLRQSLCKEAEFINVTLQRCRAVIRVLVNDIACSTDERSTAADTTQTISLEGCAQLLVHIDVSHVACTVHRHGVVVPLVVAPVTFHLDGEAVRTVHQLLSFESDVELVLCTVVLLQTTSVREQCTTTLCVGLEPEHQGVVLLLRAVQCRLQQFHTLVGLLQTQ